MRTFHGSSGIRVRAGTALIYVLSLVLSGSAIAKFVQIPKVVTEMSAMGFDGGKLMLIASLELASAILFLYPRTRSFGLLMVSAYLGGAIATHVGHNELPFQPGFVLTLFWIAALLRHPQTLWSFTHRSS